MSFTLETTAFNMFKCPSTDEFKRHVMETVKGIIESTPRITVNKLKAVMLTRYFIGGDDVDGALSALANAYECISSFKVPDRDAIHLNTKPSVKWDQRNSQQIKMA